MRMLLIHPALRSPFFLPFIDNGQQKKGDSVFGIPQDKMMLFVLLLSGQADCLRGANISACSTFCAHVRVD